MARKPLIAEEVDSVGQTENVNLDEVDQVLTALRRLNNQVASPVIRECLAAVRADIAHLAVTAAKGDDEEEDDEEEEDDDFPEEDDDDLDDDDDFDEDEDEDDDDLDDEA